MENLLSDVFLNVLCPLLDGLTLARLAGVCKRFHFLIWGDARSKKAMNYHLIWLNHPSEFLEVTGIQKGSWWGTVGLRYEGKRAFVSKTGYYGEFNDFYPIGNQVEREIDSFRNCKDIRNFLLVMYRPLVNDRFELDGKLLGTIHRGTSIIIYSDFKQSPDSGDS